MTVGPEGYNKWALRTRDATVSLLRLYQEFPRVVYAYEALASDTNLPILVEALGLEFSDHQLDYLLHCFPNQVRSSRSSIYPACTLHFLNCLKSDKWPALIVKPLGPCLRNRDREVFF